MKLKKSILAIFVAYVTLMLTSYVYTFHLKGVAYGEPDFFRYEFPFLVLLAGMMAIYVAKQGKNLPLITRIIAKPSYFLWGFLPLFLTLLIFWMGGFQMTWAFLMPFVATLCVGIGEEFLFRRVILTYFLNYFSTHKAVALSSICFGLFHAINVFAGSDAKTVLLQVFVTTLSGFYYAYLYLFTQKITWCAVDHGLWDYLVFSNAAKTNPTVLGAIILQQGLRFGLAIFMARKASKQLTNVPFSATKERLD